MVVMDRSCLDCTRQPKLTDSYGYPLKILKKCNLRSSLIPPAATGKLTLGAPTLL